MSEFFVNGIRHVSFLPEDGGHKRVQIMFDKPSKTDQSFKKDCDINLMVKRFMKTNRLNNVQFMNYMVRNAPNFDSEAIVDGDIPDYQFHVQAQVEADEMFMSLPSDIRKKFDNDPGKFLDFAFKLENRPALADMGLLKPEVAQRLKDSLNANNGVSGGSPSGAASSSAAPVSSPTNSST